jgi:hypothetical protein
MLSPFWRHRILLLLGIALCAAMFVWVGQTFQIPVALSGSLLQQPSSDLALIIVAVTFFAATLVGSAIAGSVRFDGGLFCACLALEALSLRNGGTMRDVLFASSSRSIFLALAIEVALLGLLVWCGWRLQWMLFRRGWLKEDSDRDGVILAEDEFDLKAIALAAQVVVMTLLMLLLSQTDHKKLVLAGVGASATAGSIAAFLAAPTQPSVWYWIGPFVVAIIGYLATYIAPIGWESGGPRGPLANLARPLPIDYASVGTAGAILGYWMSRRWQRNRDEAEEEASDAAQV